MEETLGLPLHLRMIGIQILLFRVRQHLDIDQIPAHGHERDVIEAEVRLVAKAMLRLHLFTDDDVLNTDAKFIVFVVARLVGNDVARRKRDF